MHFPLPSLTTAPPNTPYLPHPAEYVVRHGSDDVRHEDIVREVQSAARAKVPDSLKAELLHKIKAILEA
jgi:hypothetical protein